MFEEPNDLVFIKQRFPFDYIIPEYQWKGRWLEILDATIEEFGENSDWYKEDGKVIFSNPEGKWDYFCAGNTYPVHMCFRELSDAILFRIKVSIP